MAQELKFVGTSSKTDNTGVVFCNDPVSVVWPYLNEIAKGSLSLSAKNDVYSKIVSSVSISNMEEALAMLIACAMLSRSKGKDRMIPSVVDRMYTTVKDWYEAESVKHNVEKRKADYAEGIMSQFLARDAVIHWLKDATGNQLVEVHPYDHANLLVQAYPGLRGAYQKFK